MATHLWTIDPPLTYDSIPLNMKNLHSPHKNKTIGDEVSQKTLGHSRINSCLKILSVQDYCYTHNPSTEEEVQEDPEMEASLGLLNETLSQTNILVRKLHINTFSHGVIYKA